MSKNNVCKKCGSSDVEFRAMELTEKKKHGVLYWICFGWFVDFLLWILLFGWKLLYQIFKKKTKTVLKTVATCQGCGYNWEVR